MIRLNRSRNCDESQRWCNWPNINMADTINKYINEYVSRDEKEMIIIIVSVNGRDWFDPYQRWYVAVHWRPSHSIPVFVFALPEVIRYRLRRWRRQRRGWEGEGRRGGMRLISPLRFRKGNRSGTPSISPNGRHDPGRLSVRSLSDRRSIAGPSPVHRRSIAGPSPVHRISIESPSNLHRISIESPSNLHQPIY